MGFGPAQGEATGGGGGGSTPLDVTTTTAATYTLSDANDVLLVNAAACTVTLHSAASAEKKLYQIVNIHSTGVVTIDGDSTETISGSQTQFLTTQWSSYTVVPDGTNFVIV